jgi:glycosyltransferase involved in cell wall biosynthesis
MSMADGGEVPKVAISVIVCTRNRCAILPLCLDAIARASANAPDVPLELIVVDNASTDDTAATLDRWSTTAAIPTRIIREPRAGLAVARNAALRAASGELIAFTDDDCRVGANYLVDMIQHFSRDEVPTLRGGRVELGDPEDLPLTIKTHDDIATYRYPLSPAGFIHGANMAMPRLVFEKVGWFDERFGAGTRFGGEDTDYVIRAHAQGIRIQYVPDITVYHFHGRRDVATAKKLYASYMRANGALYLKHLRTNPHLIRLFIWDLRLWIRDFLRRTPSDGRPYVSRGAVVAGNLAGMVSYSTMLVRLKLGSILRR